MSGSERGTRAQIARLILENGPATATGLSARLSLTPAAVRRHLDNLLAEGMIETRIARSHADQGPRPARPGCSPSPTPAAVPSSTPTTTWPPVRCASWPSAPGLRRSPSSPAGRSASWRAGTPPRWAPGRPASGCRPWPRRCPRTVTRPRPAAPRAMGGGEQLCQHHCPVAHVAAEYPQLCEAETEAFGRLLGTPVQRLATIAHGDGICTTHITAPSLLKNPAPARSRCDTTSPEAPPHDHDDHSSRARRARQL